MSTGEADEQKSGTPKKTSGLAIAGLVLGILGFIGFYGLAVIGLVLAGVGVKQARSGERKGEAIAWWGVGLCVLSLVMYLYAALEA